MPSSSAPRARRSPLDRVVDTLVLARRRHPAGPNSLDALCKRYGIDLSQRTKHGALLDSMLLANVYVELLGERQATLGLGGQNGQETTVHLRVAAARQRPAPLPSRLTAESEQAHRTFVETLGPKALWLRYTELATLRPTRTPTRPLPLDAFLVGVGRQRANLITPAICSPEPPNAVGKSFIFGRPSFIGRTVSA